MESYHWKQKALNARNERNLNIKRTFYRFTIFNMYNLTTNREMMPPSEQIENAEANCDAINDHIDSIGELTETSWEYIIL